MEKLYKDVNLAIGVVSFNLCEVEKTEVDGKAVTKRLKTVDNFVVNPANLGDLPDNLSPIHLHAMLHGLSQKIGDCNAAIKGALKKFEASKAEWDRMVTEKTWNKASRTAEPKIKVSELAEKLKAQGLTEDQIAAIIGSI
jgi:hypothetical protein